jgi:hypothetical protein
VKPGNHDKEELLLAAVARGEEPPELAELDPAEREEARDWLATARALARFGQGERKARGSEPEPTRADVELARAFLRRQRVRRRRFPRSLALAAALVLLLGALFLLRQVREDARRPEPFLLGAATLELVEPVGEVESFGTFRWREVALPPGGTYRLVVEDAERELLRLDGLTRASHVLSAPERAELAAARTITWSVSARSGDDAGTVLAWGSTEASQRSP